MSRVFLFMRSPNSNIYHTREAPTSGEEGMSLAEVLRLLTKILEHVHVHGSATVAELGQILAMEAHEYSEARS